MWKELILDTVLMLVIIRRGVVIAGCPKGLIERPDSTWSWSKGQSFRARQRFLYRNLHQHQRKQQQQQQQQQQSEMISQQRRSHPKLGLTKGSILTYHPPTPERIARWFGQDYLWIGLSRSKRTSMMTQDEILFNHDAVGITNPLLHIETSLRSKPSSGGGSRVRVPKNGQEQRQRKIAGGGSSSSSPSDSSVSSSSLSVHDGNTTATAMVTKVTPSSRNHVQHFQQLAFLKIAGGQQDDHVAHNHHHELAQQEQDEGQQLDIPLESAWWPSTLLSDLQFNRVVGLDSSISSKNDPGQVIKKGGWRVLCHRLRVGYGPSCYQKVRDAALAWEFTSPTGNQGIRTVRPPTPDEWDRVLYGVGYDQFNSRTRTKRGSWIHFPFLGSKSRRRQSQQHPHHQSPFYRVHEDPSLSGSSSASSALSAHEVWSGPARRLVSYTKTKIIPWLYAISPVTVVYDILDQPAPLYSNTTQYTCTAFGTGPGHWLCGEERVCVLQRNNGAIDVEIISFSRPTNTLWGKYIIWPCIGHLQKEFFQQQINALLLQQQ